MREFFGILGSLVAPFFGAIGQVLSGQFGWRPIAALAVQVVLQLFVVFGFFTGNLVGGGIAALALILCHTCCAFLVFAQGIGLAFEIDKHADKNGKKGNTALEFYKAYAAMGYITAAVVALILSGGILLILKAACGVTFGVFLKASLLSIGVGAAIDVVRVLWPMYVADRQRRSSIQ